MAVRDIEAFMRERGLLYDGNLDVNPGSPFDVQVIQPLIRRLGTDPFTVDLTTFISDRMRQAFPDIANQDDDAITDLLNKPATLLWDPVVREIIRVRQNLSFSDPTRMTVDEADALGANFFSTRKTGQYSRGPGRILFQNAQNVSISPANFFTAKGGLHFFPTETQSIRLEEMLLNITEDGLYYFDVNLIAEQPGSSYNIEPNSLISVANVPSATRVTNTRRFSRGNNEENAQSFISRVKQELGERSLVTLRGIAAKIVNNFPEVNRLNVVGFNDPEMERDVIKGGGLGSILASGVDGLVLADGEGAARSRRFYEVGQDFVSLFGTTGPTSGWVLTVFDAFGASADVQELNVIRVVGTQQLDVEEQVMVVGSSGLRWTLRRRELTLSNIPGGILLPNRDDGTVVVPDDEVHVGGMYDTFIRGTDFSEEVFTIDNVTDDEPLLSGVEALKDAVSGVDGFTLDDYGTTPSSGLLAQLDEAVRFGYSLQIQDGPNAGTYRIVDTQLTGSGQAFLATDPVPTVADAVGRRWRLFDVINVDLLNPRETRIEGTDLVTLQNSDVVTVPTGTDFITLGVSKDDVFELLAGADAGTYTVLADPTSPTQVQLDTVLSTTGSSLSYRIYRGNQGGALVPPFVRVTKVELLDSSGQPVGTEVPYARPVDVQTRAFQNPSRGIKYDYKDVRLGLVSEAVTTFAYAAGQTLVVWVEGASPDQRTLTLTQTSPDVATAVADINAQMLAVYGIPEATQVVGGNRLGFRPVGASGFVAIVGGTAKAAIFGSGTELYTTGDIRSDDVDSLGGWDALDPPLDLVQGLDVVQPVDGNNVGFYASPFTVNYLNAAKWASSVTASSALLIGELLNNDTLNYLPVQTFSPESRRRVQFGARSLGSARVFFLEPTSFEVDADALFTLETDVGALSFIPDPTLDHQRIPALPSNDVPQDGQCTESGTTFTSASQDFVLSGIQPGDKLSIETQYVEATIVLADPVQNLVGETLVFSFDGEEDRTVIFLRDDASLSEANREVTRDGVVTQINDSVGEEVCELTGSNTIRFITAKTLVIRQSGSANSVILGTVAGTTPAVDFTVQDVPNDSPFEGLYDITDVSTTSLEVSPAFPPSNPPYPSTVTNQAFRVYRTGVQRISTSEMSENEAEAGLYYFDVELVSQGTGDQYNIGADEQLTIEGFRSDGYYLTTDEEILAFSSEERPKLVLSRSILEDGVDDDPRNATQLTGENIQVSYDRSGLVSDVQSFLSSETERVVCSNPLSRHLTPMFVRLDLLYQGGSAEDVVLEDIDEYIVDLAPIDTMDSSDIQKLVSDRGATYIQNPLDLIGVVHRNDRSIWITRSQDQLTVGRLTSFIPDLINVTRDVT